MNIHTYFTKETDVKSIILDLLNEARTKVVVAVAWFTDPVLFNKLVELQERGVLVEVIITKHEFNQQSPNSYEVIERNGGFFAEIGSDEQLMHMKFCVIDYAVVISGSANWSKRAFKGNNEEVTIVDGHYERVNNFISEFERLKQVSGKMEKLNKELNISQAIKTFDLVKAFVNLGEVRKIQPYIHQLKDINELEEVSNLLFQNRFEEAFVWMDSFKRSYTQLTDLKSIEKEQLKSQNKLLSFQIENLEIEKIENETLLAEFNHRYIIELNPVVFEILALKKKVYEKLNKYGIYKNTYESIEREFKTKKEEYEEEIKKEIPILSNDEMKSIKEMYREGSNYCHPDSQTCIFEDKEKSAEVFSELSIAYKNKDIERVKFIWSKLKLGKPINNIDKYSELTALKVRFESLKIKYSYLSNKLSSLKSSESYLMIIKIEDWDQYFETQKEELKKELSFLRQKFVKSEHSF